MPLTAGFDERILAQLAGDIGNLTAQEMGALLTAIEQRHGLRGRVFIALGPNVFPDAGSVPTGIGAMISGLVQQTAIARMVRVDGNGHLIVSPPSVPFDGNLNVQAQPAAAAALVANFPAGGANVRNILAFARFTIACAAAAQAATRLRVREGGADLATAAFACPANDVRVVDVVGPIFGTANLQMDFDTTVVGAAGVVQSFFAVGYKVTSA